MSDIKKIESDLIEVVLFFYEYFKFGKLEI